MSLSRAALLDAFRAGVAAANPATALTEALSAKAPNADGKALHLFAIGKAARAMAAAAVEHFGTDRIQTALVVTNPENSSPLPGAEVFATAHPVPDQAGLRAGQRIIERLERLGAQDHVLALVSGGASSLVPAPAEGLGLSDKIAVNELLLSSGFEITQMNLVRQNLSRLKGGGFLRLAAPAQVTSYILSDVLGDDLRVIGSGPTVGPVGDAAEAVRLLKDRGLWPQLPIAAQRVLSRAKPAPALPQTAAHLIGSNGHSLTRMAHAAAAKVSAAPLTGDVQQAAERVIDEAMAMPPGTTLAFGGETTVRLTGTGKGGRNQELALRVVSEAHRRGLSGRWRFLSGGTDGRDGPTDAAGALVDKTTLDRLGAAGIDLEAVLADNASYDALAAVGDLLITGATGTNVADLQLFARG